VQNKRRYNQYEKRNKAGHDNYEPFARFDMRFRNGGPRDEAAIAEKSKLKRLQVDAQIVENFFDLILAKVLVLENFVFY
jgi:hypothetical protein